MRDVHGLAAGRNEFRPRGAAASRMEALATPGLNCDLFRSGRALKAVEVQFCDLSNLTAIEAVRLIAKGELRAEEYALRLLERYRALKSLNAVTWMQEERVLESARAIDRRREAGVPLGPLGGLPVIIKDNIDVAGTPTAAASAIFAGNMRHSNATVAQRLFDAGAVFFGKANMHELACGGTTSNPTTGVCENPYDRRRIPGGSSGGTAAAIAARLVPAGLGSDTIGSIRIPAAMCGTAGLRPTTLRRKLYSDDGLLPLASDLDTAGPMARTVADVALLHAAITGSPQAPACDLRATRIGVPIAPYWERIDPEVARVAQNALIHLQAAGATLVDVDASAYFALASEAHATLLISGMKADLPRYLRSLGSTLTLEDLIGRIASRDARAHFERAARAELSPAQIEEARGQSRHRAAQAYAAMFTEHRLAAIVFPTQPMQPPPIEPEEAATDEARPQVAGAIRRIRVSKFRNTHVTGVLGAPGLSIPAGLTAQGLPVGLEFDALAGSDSELLALGIAVEQAWPKIPAPQPIA